MKFLMIRFLLALVVLSAASLACNLPASMAPQSPTTAPMSTEDLQTLENQLQATLQSPSTNGEVTLTITEQQLNAVIASEVASQSEPRLTDPHVKLTQGQMEVTGNATQSGISAPVRATLQPSVDSNGNPRLEVMSMELGSFPVPDVLKEQVQSIVNQALWSYMASNGNQFEVTRIEISEGQLSVTGVPQTAQ